MKRILSLLLAAVLLVSAIPTAFAADTNDYTAGTQVSYNAEDPDGDGIVNSNEAYTITVPALLAPGGSGTVTLQGTWASDRIVTVTADTNVVLTNSINAADQKVLKVTFDGISEAGNNIAAQTFTEPVSVDAIQNAMFGVWSGKFNYNVAISNTPNTRLEGDGQTFHTMAPSTLSFRSTAPLDEFQEVQVNGVTVAPSNYTLTEGSTIVTLSIDYLKTLDVAAHEITVVSNSGSPSAGFEVVAPDLNEHGFYYNQPYTAYVSAYSDNVAFFFREDGSMDLIFVNSGYTETASFTSSACSVVVNAAAGTFNGTVSADGKEVYCTELATNFVLGNKAIVADEDYIYTYDESLDGYSVTAISKTQAEYRAIKTGINGISTVKLADDMFVDIYVGSTAGNPNLVIAPVIPNTVTIIGESAFNWCENLTSVTIPSSVTIIDDSAFWGCDSLTSITFEGTMEQWDAISIGGWHALGFVTEIVCSDGTVALS